MHNGILWSLNVEEHSYVYLVLGTIIVAKSRGLISATIFLIASVVAILGVTVFYMIGFQSFGSSPWRIHTEVASLGLVAFSAIVTWRFNNNEIFVSTSKFFLLLF